MLVTIGAQRGPNKGPIRAQLPNHTTPLFFAETPAGYPNKKAKKKIEIARDLFSLPIMLRALSCFFFPSIQLPYDTTTAATATRTA